MLDQNILVRISIIYCMVHMLVLFSLLYEYRGSRRRFWTATGIVVGLSSAACLYLLFTRGVAVMGQYGLLIGTLPTLLLFFLFAKERSAKFVFIFCLADTVSMWVQLSSGLIDYALGGTGVVTLVLRLVSFPLLEYAVWRWLRRPFLELGSSFRRCWTLFAALTGACYVILALVSVYPTMIFQRPEDIPMAVMLLILVALTYSTIFMVIRQQTELSHIRERQHILEAQAGMMERRAFEVRRSEEKLAIGRHDLRHRLQSVAALIRQGDTAAALEYIGASQTDLDQTGRPRLCQNVVLDALLSSYLEQIREQGIALETRLSIPDTLPVDATELSTVFANALENAARACEKLPKEQRRIVCTCVTEPRLMFEIGNPYAGTISFGPGGLPLSERPGHGLGTRSIMAFAEKHNAVCRFRAENGWFKVQVAL